MNLPQWLTEQIEVHERTSTYECGCNPEEMVLCTAGQYLNGGVDLMDIVRDGIKVEGHRGTWYVIGETTRGEGTYYLLEHETHGEDADAIAINSRGENVFSHITGGMTELNMRINELCVECRSQIAMDYDFKAVKMGAKCTECDAKEIRGKRLAEDTWATVFANEDIDDEEDGTVEVVWLESTDEYILAIGYEVLEDGFMTEKEAQDRLEFVAHRYFAEEEKKDVAIFRDGNTYSRHTSIEDFAEMIYEGLMRDALDKEEEQSIVEQYKDCGREGNVELITEIYNYEILEPTSENIAKWEAYHDAEWEDAQ